MEVNKVIKILEYIQTVGWFPSVVVILGWLYVAILVVVNLYYFFICVFKSIIR